MTPTEKLIAEARKLCAIDTTAEIYPLRMIEVMDALCDALENTEKQLQEQFDKTGAWLEEYNEMKIALVKAQEQNKQLMHEVCKLACESVERDIALAKLEAEVMAAIETQNAQRWIPVTERLPRNEQRVLICATRQLSNGRVLQIRSMAMYEDGTMATGNSGYCWDECDFQYSEELDDHLVPQGWWEQLEYSENFCAVDDFVTHWMPLPEPPKGED